MIRVLVTGARGQVGGEVARLLHGRAEVVAHDRSTLDLAQPRAIVERVREARPRLIVNAGAYTAVDRAEAEIDAARAVNARAPEVLAEEARRSGALLVHYSTDYVFDGTKEAPYVEDDSPAPVNAYGATKLEGERAVAASGCAHVILRTSWVYGPRGRNFMRTMLAAAKTRRELRVVDDQRGAPTTSLALARATLAMVGAVAGTGEIAEEGIERAASLAGLYHATAAGETTWFGFARAIFEEWAARVGPSFSPPAVSPIPTKDYPTPARRPANSVLSNERLARELGVRLPPWREGLAEAISLVDA
ncbi:MAG TPA: dTDP-4-dehydrorhamnose reductase [Usitatibacter sp.]|nr:dTDP-4-dehydrorhamnose reductase [Usitatibacter sp.]